MKALLRAELFKLRTTRSTFGLLIGMVGLVALVVVLHGLGLPAGKLTEVSNQMEVFGRGEFLAVLFAALFGALSITGEFRHGTIRPTLLVSPRRGRVVAAKALTSALGGVALGLVASALAAGVGAASLGSRGIALNLTAGDFALLIGGSSAAAALWGAIGVGIGALVRNQVPTVVGICAWLLFVEGLLVGDVAGVRKIGRFAPGAAGQALSGQYPGVLLGALSAGLLLFAYADIAAIVGWQATVRRDVT